MTSVFILKYGTVVKTTRFQREFTTSGTVLRIAIWFSLLLFYFDVNGKIYFLNRKFSIDNFTNPSLYRQAFFFSCFFFHLHYSNIAMKKHANKCTVVSLNYLMKHKKLFIFANFIHWLVHIYSIKRNGIWSTVQVGRDVNTKSISRFTNLETGNSDNPGRLERTSKNPLGNHGWIWQKVTDFKHILNISLKINNADPM